MSTEKRARQKANRATRVAAAETAARQARIRSRIITYGALAVVVVVAIVVVAALTGGDDAEPAAIDPGATAPATPATPSTTTSSVAPLVEGECPAVDGSSPRRIDFPGPQPTCIDPAASYTAVFDTSEGEIRVELDAQTAPNTVNNFVTLARWHYYDGTTIFRTDPSIDIIQGGAPHTESPSDPGPGYTIPDEGGPYTYVPGQLVMARTAAPDSSSAQFFFTTGENASALDSQGTYLVFGTTDDAGLGVLQDIIALHEPGGSLGGAPSRPVTVESVTVLEE